MKDEYLKVAKQAALEAGEIILKYFGKEHKLKFKNNDKSDFATQADLEAEQKIIQILTENFPNHNIIAEESGRTQKDSDYTWVIDPLDGTSSFARGFPYFGVSVGLLKNNKPILGVIYHVLAKDLYYAEINKGAYVNGKQIFVSEKKDLEEAVIAMEYGHHKRRSPKLDLYIVPLMKKSGYIYSLGSAAMCLGLCAKGIQDGAVMQAWIWDFTAGAVIVKEAGGKVTDFGGKDLDWTKERLNIVASNGLIHDQIITALRK